MRLLTLFFVVQRSLQPACCGSTQTRWPSCAANGAINIGMDLALLSGPSCEGDIAMHSRACTTLSVVFPLRFKSWSTRAAELTTFSYQLDQVYRLYEQLPQAPKPPPLAKTRPSSSGRPPSQFHPSARATPPGGENVCTPQ